MAIEEELSLDIGPAVSALDDFDARVEQTAQAAEDALTAAFASALDQAGSVADILSDSISVGISTGAADGAAALQDALNTIEPPDFLADLGVDTSGVDDASGSISDLIGAESEASADIPVTVETTSVEEATQTLDQLAQTEQSVSDTTVQVGVDTSGVDQGTAGLEQFSTGVDKASASSAAGEVAAGGLLSRLQTIGPAGAAAALGVGAVGFGLEEFVKSGTRSLQGTQRLERAYGDLSDQVQQININGLTTDLSSLSIQTGSSAAGVKIAVANLAELGQATGATSEQTLTAGQNFGALANYIAATRPELGGAEQIATRLGRALQQGGRFALSLGLPLNSTAEITQRAAEKFGVATEELTSFQKQSAALDIVMERLGPNFKKNLDDGLKSPVVQIRSVEAALKATIATAGRPIATEFVDALHTLQPLVESLVSSLGGLAGGAIAATAGGLQALTVPLQVVSTLISAIPAPVLAGAAAFVVGSKAFSLAADGAVKLGGSISALLTRITAARTGGGISQIFSVNTATTSQLKAVSGATEEVIASQVALKTVLAEQAVTSAAAGDALAAYQLSEEADTAAGSARVAVIEAEVAAEAALATATSGSAADRAAAVAAQEALTIAQQADVVATEEAVVAKELYATQIGIVTAENTAGAAQIVAADTAATVANDALAGSLVTAEAASLSLSAALGPIGILLGVVAAGYAIFSSGSDDTTHDLQEQKQATDEAAKSFQQYSDSLKLTNVQSAGLGQDRARSEFEQSSAAADHFIDQLKSIGQLKSFNNVALDIGLAGRALNGNADDAEEFRKSLIAAGEVKFADPTKGGLEPDDEYAARLRHQADLLKQHYIETGQITGGADKTGTDVSPLAREFDKEAIAAQKAATNFVEAARAETAAGGASGVAAIQTAANLGLLDRLNPAEEAHAKALLATVTATEGASTAAADLAEGYGALGTTAGQALDTLSRGATPDLSGLESLRAIASDPDFAKLPQTTQDLVTQELKSADSARQSAAAHGDLITSFGEVSTSVVDLEGKLKDAASAYLSISGAPAQLAKDNRDALQSIRDLGDQTKDLGTSLDAGSAKFDSGSITVQNYHDALALLPQATQDAINAIGGGGATDTAVAKIQAVRQALVDLHTAGQDPVHGLVDINTKVGKDNVDDILKLLPESIQTRIKFTTDDSSLKDTENKAATEAQKAAATRAAVAKASGTTLDDLTTKAQDNSDKLNDYFDTVGTNIRKVIADAAEQKRPLEEIQATAATLVEKLRTAGENAGLTKDQIDKVIEQQRLTPGDIQIDFHASGLDGIITSLQRLSLILLGLPPDALANILAIKDPTNQLDAINAAISKLTPDQQVAVKAVLDVPSETQTKSDLDVLTQDRTVTVDVKARTEGALNNIADFLGLPAGSFITPDTGVPAPPAPAPPQPGRVGGSAPGSEGVDRAPNLSDFVNAFPKNPKLGDEATVGGKRFLFTRTGWVPLASASAPRFGAFATGGFTGDPKIDDAIRRRDALGQTGAVAPGEYSAGSYAIGEANSRGEYVISRRADQRGRNVDLLGSAAANFGLGLVPSGAQAQIAPTVISAPSADPQLIGAIGDLSAVVAAHWSPTVNANITERSPAQSLDELFDHLDEMRFLGPR